MSENRDYAYPRRRSIQRDMMLAEEARSRQMRQIRYAVLAFVAVLALTLAWGLLGR